MNPHDDPDDYRCIVLGTMVSPGIVTLSGHDRIPKWDNKEAKGQEGASCTLSGLPIGTFAASFFLCRDDYEGINDFDAWDEFQKLIESTTNGPVPKALQIYHPDLARNAFTEVVNAGIGGMIHDKSGGATVIVKFQEYRPPRPKRIAKAVSIPGPPPGIGIPKVDPNAVAKAELAALLLKAQATP